MLHFGRPNTHCQRPERAMRGGVAVATHHRGARLRQSQLRTDHVHDALLGIPHGMQADAEFFAVLPKGLNLGAGHRIGDRLVDVDRRHIVVFGRDRQVRPAHLAPSEPKTIECLRTGHLVHQVQVDIDEIGLARLTLTGSAYHYVGVPDLLCQGPGLLDTSHHWLRADCVSIFGTLVSLRETA
ncbi:Uncharacterised protein [Mycobacteroides abscessus subsp. abscessus]|nr:Uncharacterised protein [Mycobacteroides abscessus subsp. abscessus]